MAIPPFKKAHAFLNHESQQLQQLFNKVRRLEEINQLLKQVLPRHLQPCQVANMQGNTLTLIVTNASQATQLRLHTADLLQQFKNIAPLQFIRDIQCKVRLLENKKNQPTSTVAKRPMQLLTKPTAALVESIADGIADPVLRASLKRIAKRNN